MTENHDVAILTLLIFLWVTLTGGLSYLIGAIDSVADKIKVLQEKRASPVHWSTQLEAHFLQKKDEEGAMLAAAVIKHLRSKNKTVVRDITVAPTEAGIEVKGYE